jgi:hypothetical protein
MDEVVYLGDRASKILFDDRNRYTKIYEVIEEFCEKHNLIIGGKIGLYMLLGKPRTVDVQMYNYEIYSENSLKHTNELTNILADVRKSGKNSAGWKQGDEFVVMKTDIQGIKYSVQYDNRYVATVWTIRKGVTDIIRPVYATGFSSGRKLYVMPSELYLLDIYKVLYTPGSAAEWDAVIADEKILFKHLKGRDDILRGKDIVDGSGDGGDNSDGGDNKQKTIGKLLAYLCNNKDIMIIGDIGFALLTKNQNSIKNIGIIHILTTFSFEDLYTLIKKCTPDATYKSYDMNIVKDFRLRRMVVKVNNREVLYAYNSAHYDIIPFSKVIDSSGKRYMYVANPFVIMRTMLIEIWMIRQHLVHGNIDEKFAKNKIDSTLSRILDLRKRLGSRLNAFDMVTESAIRMENQSMRIFQDKNSEYFGTYISEKKYIKDLSAESEKKFYDYLPQKYFQTHHTYRPL